MQYFLEAELFCCHPSDSDFAVTSEVVIKSEVTAKKEEGKKKCTSDTFVVSFLSPKYFVFNCIEDFLLSFLLLQSIGKLVSFAKASNK